MRLASLSGRVDQTARFAAALLGFSIPISVAFDNILLLLVAVLWLASGDLRARLSIIAAHPVALAALALFGMLAAGLFYGTRDDGDGIRHLGKYIDLLFIPVFITLFRDARARDLALRCFCAAMVITFVVAEFTAAGHLEGNALLPRASDFPGAFKHSVTHGLLAAFAAFVFALLAQRQKEWPLRVMFAVLALVAIKNVLLVSVSRTAYVVLALLSVYFFRIAFRNRGFWVAILALVALFAGTFASSATFRERTVTVAVETLGWQSDQPSQDSVDIRLEWYKHSLDIVLEHPVLGAGTGSFARAYAETVKNPQMRRTANPHNEYLLIAVQVGLVGVALLLHLFWRQLALAPRIADPFAVRLAQGLVITIAVGCLFNSLLVDHTEGLFYAWFTGLLFGGLGHPPPGHPSRGNR